jgi:predicted ribosome quality control (RQC) complex YloA/Tae2 family protein
MGFDYFTIRQLSAELAAGLEGRQLARTGSNGAELGLETRGAGHLRAALGRGGWVCWLPDMLPRHLQAREGAEPYLEGARIEQVWPDPRERLLWLRLSRPDSAGNPSYGLLVFELIHPHFQAYLLSERSRLVLGRWGGKLRLTQGQPYAPPPATYRLLPGGEGVEDFVAANQAAPVTPQSLAPQLVGMDELIAGQLLERSGLGKGGLLGAHDLRKLWQISAELYGRQPDGKGYVWEGERGRHFSGLEPLTQPAEVWPRISQAIQRVCLAPKSSQDTAAQDLVQRLLGARSVLQRRLKAVAHDLGEAEVAELCERQAALLLANLGAVPRGAQVVELVDAFDNSGQRRVRIELDPRRPVAETAARLAKTAEKYRRRQELLPRRLAGVRAALAEVERLLEHPQTTSEEAEGWLRRQGMDITQKDHSGHRSPQAHPRRYRTTTGWSVWAGRNNAENDLLSHRLAAQNDYWFHAHGYPGSHVVLRREGRKDEPNAQTLREAAGVAAYWSKGKTAKKVSVVYTLVKYVSKPKGGAPGQALMKREKSLMVEPKLLPEETEVEK